MSKVKQKPKQVSKPVEYTIDQEPPKTTTTTTTEADKLFETELCWCIQQLQTALRLGKLNQKQMQDHTKALNTLASRTAPLVRKRQVMRLSFGDYRSKMAADEKRLSKVNAQIKLSQGKPNTKSVFLRKSGGFKFDFDMPSGDEPIQAAQNNDCDNTVSMETEKGCNDSVRFHFVPSNNRFKFDFDVSN